MWRTIGHEAAVRMLERSVEEGRLAHAYLLVGPQNVGKMNLALELAQAVNCLDGDRPCGHCSQCQRIASGRHADVQVICLEAGEGERTRAEIGIEQVREVQRAAGLRPYEGSSRVFIFDGVEHLSDEAANCLLKTLEEPPSDVLLVLLASNEEALLPTIVSRCQRLELRPLPARVIAQELEANRGTDRERAWEMARLSRGRPGWALQALTDPTLLERQRESLKHIESAVKGGIEERFTYAAELASLFSRDRGAGRRELRLWLDWWRDVLVTKEGVAEIVVNYSRLDLMKGVAEGLSSREVVGAIKAILDTMDHLERNANPRLALEALMLALPPVGDGMPSKPMESEAT